MGGCGCRFFFLLQFINHFLNFLFISQTTNHANNLFKIFMEIINLRVFIKIDFKNIMMFQ